MPLVKAAFLARIHDRDLAAFRRVVARMTANLDRVER